MDPTKLKIVRVLAKKHRRVSTPLVGLVDMDVTAPSSTNVSSSDASPVCLLGDYEGVARLVQLLPMHVGVRVRQVSDPSSYR